MDSQSLIVHGHPPLLVRMISVCPQKAKFRAAFELSHTFFGPVSSLGRTGVFLLEGTARALGPRMSLGCRVPDASCEPFGPRRNRSARLISQLCKVNSKCHRYSCVTCPNRRSKCLSLNLPISKSVVRLNATEPAWPNTFQSPCARCIAAAGLGQSIGSPAAMPPPSSKSKGNATKRVISAIRSHFCKFTSSALQEASP
jgi:hypothetical protein